jgi:hypothetical protein
MFENEKEILMDEKNNDLNDNELMNFCVHRKKT